MKFATLFIVLLLVFGVTSTLAQDVAVLLLAAVQIVSVWLYGFEGDPIQITDGTASNLVWSPDGEYLAFITLDQDFKAALSLYIREDNVLTIVDGDVLAGFPASFANDGSQLV